METQNLCALVTDAHYRMSLALCRDLGQAGVKVVTCERESLRGRPGSPPLGGLSRYVSRHVWLPDEGYADALFALCQSLSGEGPTALLPVGAGTLSVLAAQRERFSAVCGMCLPTTEQLDLLNDKEAVMGLAGELAGERGLLSIGGSDAHHRDEVGNAYTVIEAESPSLADLRGALEAGRCRAVLEKETSYTAKGMSQWAKRRRAGGPKNLAIGAAYIVRCLLKDMLRRS